MIENNKLLEMTLTELLSLNQDYKMKVIQLLINQILFTMKMILKN